MRFISTKSKTNPVSLADAINRCVAPDGGLYMPETIPAIPKALFNNIGDMNLKDIAFVVATAFFDSEIPAHVLKNIVDESFVCDAPLVKVGDTYVLELFHGPTLTFKDYGARFMARLMKYIDRRDTTPRRNVLVATMGNTGAAAANGLFKLDGISVCVLYPHGALTKIQTSQFTALGGNIHPVEIAGTVEDCKHLVQAALADPTLSDMHLTGANSINLARLIPQVTFAMYAYARLAAMGVHNAGQMRISIPCGNLSNLVAASIARRMGLPMGPLVAATNANNQLAPLLDGADFGKMTHRPTRTITPSIDMSCPSGWPRLYHLYDGDLARMRNDITVAPAVSDDEVRATVNAVRERFGYSFDTHGALAYAAVQVSADPSAPKVVFATGHPAKQPEIITDITGCEPGRPEQMKQFSLERRHSIIIPPTLPALRKHLYTINNQ